MATSQELIRAPGTRNQPERPRGREAKQADLGTIYSGRPPINPASNRQHDSNKRSMLLSSNSQAPLDLWRSSLITQGFDIPIRHGFSHSTPAGEADVTSSDSIRAAMTSSQPQLDFDTLPPPGAASTANVSRDADAPKSRIDASTGRQRQHPTPHRLDDDAAYEKGSDRACQKDDSPGTLALLDKVPVS